MKFHGWVGFCSQQRWLGRGRLGPPADGLDQQPLPHEGRHESRWIRTSRRTARRIAKAVAPAAIPAARSNLLAGGSRQLRWAAPPTRPQRLWGWTDPATGRSTPSSGYRTAPPSSTSPTRTRRSTSASCRPTPTPRSGADQGLPEPRLHRRRPRRRHGMQVFDLTRLRNVTDRRETFTGAAPATPANSAAPTTSAINEETGFVYSSARDTCTGGLHMVDIREPEAAAFAGCYSDRRLHPREPVRRLPRPDTTYQRPARSASPPTRTPLTVVDVTNKAAPAHARAHDLRRPATPTRAGSPRTTATSCSTTSSTRRRPGTTPGPTSGTCAEPRRTRCCIGTYIGPHARRSTTTSSSRATTSTRPTTGPACGSSTSTNVASRRRCHEVGYFDVDPANDGAASTAPGTSTRTSPAATCSIIGIEQGLFVVRPEAQP